MALSEFRYNKKRKHFSYVFDKNGTKRKNIVLSTKPEKIEKRKKGKKKIYKNIPLYKNPNPSRTDDSYLINKVYIDEETSFGNVKPNWNFDINDKRKVKRLKKGKWK